MTFVHVSAFDVNFLPICVCIYFYTTMNRHLQSSFVPNCEPSNAFPQLAHSLTLWGFTLSRLLTGQMKSLDSQSVTGARATQHEQDKLPNAETHRFVHPSIYRVDEDYLQLKP